ncbi:MAG: DUF2141 domain-containing protein [Alphaproteobacteria bacterium]
MLRSNARILYRVILALTAGLGLPAAGGAADLEVEITGIRSASGMVRLALYNDAAKFPKRSGSIAGGDIRAAKGSIVFVFKKLPPGVYAVAIYHDANANRKFDKSSLGLPREGFGFSKDARPFLSAPGFDSAAVTLKAPRTRIKISLAYWFSASSRP